MLRRAGHTEAAVDLARLAGQPAVGALCEIVSDERPGEMAGGPELRRFADRHGLVMIEIADLAGFRRRTEPQVRRVTATSLPTTHGLLCAVGYLGVHDGAEHLAIVAGRIEDVPGHSDAVHVHVECLSGDVFGSLGCSCRASLDAAIQRICARGSGAVVYLRPPGRTRTCAFQRDSSAADPEVLRATADRILDDLGVGPRIAQRDGRRRRPHPSPRSVAG